MDVVYLEDRVAAFIAERRVARMSTVAPDGEPYVVPICYAYDGARFYTPIDEKPKRRDRPLKRIRNIEATGRVALVIDRYEEDWSRLAWVMVRGRASVIEPGEPGHAEAVRLLRVRYEQYRSMALESAPVIAISPTYITSWGHLTGDESPEG